MLEWTCQWGAYFDVSDCGSGMELKTCKDIVFIIVSQFIDGNIPLVCDSVFVDNFVTDDFSTENVRRLSLHR